MTWVGLDLHKRYITVCALDDAGMILAEHRRLPADETTLLGWLGKLPAPVTVAMEATVYWAWLHDRLTAPGYAAVVAHPRQVKLIWHARCKTDPIDARKLAELARTNLLPAIWIPDAEARTRRKLLRGRAYLVRLRTRVKNRIHGYLTAENCRCLVTDLYGKAGRAWLQAVPLPEGSRLQVHLLLETHDFLEVRIARLDQRIRQTVRQDTTAEQLQRRARDWALQRAAAARGDRPDRPLCVEAISSRPMLAWSRVRGAPAIRRRTAPWVARAVPGSSGC
jgi:transposase